MACAMQEDAGRLPAAPYSGWPLFEVAKSAHISYIYAL